MDMDSGWRRACRLGGIAALVSLVASLATMVVLFTVGGPPGTAEETFALLQDDRFVGLFRLETSWVDRDLEPPPPVAPKPEASDEAPDGPGGDPS